MAMLEIEILPKPHILEDRRNYIDMRRPTDGERHRLILDHIVLVASVAQKYRSGKVPFDELMAAGREGLVKSAHSFDPARGEFLPWAIGGIESSIMVFCRSYSSQWFPKETDAPNFPLEGEKIEKIYEWDCWGEMGNAIAISESWVVAGASPEDIALAHSEVKEKKDRFAAAFISLTSIERKMVRAVYLSEPPVSIEGAAREIGISRWRASRSLKRALVKMREIIGRIERNERQVA